MLHPKHQRIICVHDPSTEVLCSTIFATIHTFLSQDRYLLYWGPQVTSTATLLSRASISASAKSPLTPRSKRCPEKKSTFGSPSKTFLWLASTLDQLNSMFCYWSLCGNNTPTRNDPADETDTLSFFLPTHNDCETNLNPHMCYLHFHTGPGAPNNTSTMLFHHWSHHSK